MIESMKADETRFLYKVLSAIRPNLEDFVLVGGFASFLYQFHERAKPIGVSPLLTYDIDLASRGKVSVRGGKTVHESLSEIGLIEEFTGSCTPPLVKYFPKDKTPPMYVEFLTPLRGSEDKRGISDVTQKIQPGLSAQKLRFLDLLLKNPWTISTSSVPGLGKHPNLVVKIPHPTMFIMQKILISGRRTDKSRVKDFAYIYQILGFFMGDWEILAREFKVLIDNPEWRRWYRKFIRMSIQLFDTPERDGPIEASRIIPQATPEMISAAVKRFMSVCPKI
ncbi:MAG: hypothetical protein FJ115_17550 [Deltaproteobacteria bacterium]|nr:hypothetical protein [Deltaproteobacteria bacterium]